MLLAVVLGLLPVLMPVRLVALLLLLLRHQAMHRFVLQHSTAWLCSEHTSSLPNGMAADRGMVLVAFLDSVVAFKFRSLACKLQASSGEERGPEAFGCASAPAVAV